MHLALGLAIAPLQREASFHRIVVFPQALGKTLQFGHSLLLDAHQPLVESFALSLAQHGGELLDQLRGFTDLPISVTKSGEVGFLPIESLFFLKRDPMGHLQGCWRPIFLPLASIDRRSMLGSNLLE